MNKNYLQIKTFLASLILVGLMSVSTLVNAQALSGAYTIDKGSPASATNFVSFNSAKDTLNKHGISAAVTFDVIGTYTEQVEFKAVTGASVTNTITFNGKGGIEFSANSSSKFHTFYLNGADYFIVDGLTIKALGTSYGVGVRLGNGADFNKIQNCDISVPNYDRISQNVQGTNQRTAGIGFYSNDRQLYYRDYRENGKENLIYNNKVYGGSGKYGPVYGIFEGGANSTTYKSNNVIEKNHIYDFGTCAISSNYASGTRIVNNKIETINSKPGARTSNWGYQYGIFTYYNSSSTTQDAEISNNTIKDLNSTVSGSNWGYSYGIYNYYPNHNGTKNFKIDGNKILNITGGITGGTYGIYNYRRSGSGKVEITNNLVSDFSGNYVYAMYTSYLSNLLYANNTVSNVNGTGAASRIYAHYLYYFNSASDVKIINNDVNLEKSSTGYMYYGRRFEQGQYPTFHKNHGYATNSSIKFLYGDFGGGTITYDDLAAIKADSDVPDDQFDGAATYLDKANNDFSILDFALNNKGDASVTTSLNSLARSATNPDIGAFEAKLDAVAQNLIFTGLNECGNYQEKVTFDVMNNTTHDFKDVPVGFSIDGVEKDAGTIASIDAGKTETFTFAKMAKFNNPGASKLEVYIQGPDDASNSDTLNKTLTITSAPYGSVFTVNSTMSGDIRTGLTQDVTIPGEKIVYDMSAPDVFTQSDYTTKWTAAPKVSESGVDLPASSYTWTPPSGSTAGTLEFDPPASYTDKVIDVCMVINDKTTGCDTTLCKEVFVAPLGKPNFKTAIVLCEGDAVLFDNISTVSTGVVENDWDFGDSKGTAKSTHPVYSYDKPGLYKVRLTNITNPYGYKTDTIIDVVVTATPKVAFDRVNACEGTAITLTNKTPDPVAGSNVHTWTFGDGSAMSNMKDEAHKYATPGSYKVTLSVEANGCTNELSKNVYQFATPVAAFTHNTGNCQNETFTFENSTTIALGQTGYLWDFDDNGSLSTETDPKYDFSSPGTKDVWLKTTSEFGCVDSTMKTIVVKAAPVSSFTNTSPCSVDPTDFTNTSVIPNGQTPTYSWDLNGVSSSTINPTHVWTSLGGPQTVSLTTTLFPNKCTHTITKDLFVGVQPSADFEVAEICTGEKAVFDNKTTWPQGTVKDVWHFGDGATSTDHNPTHTYSNTNAAVINVTLYSTVEGGCTDSVTKQVIINEGPKTCDFVIGNKYVESHTYAEFTPTDGATPGAQTGVTYTWKFEGGGTSTDPVAKHHFPTGNTYDITMIARKGDCDCIKTKTFTVNFVGLKDADLAKNVIIFPNPNNGRFTVQMAGNTTNATAKLFTITGSLVKEIALNKEVNVSNLSAGLYLVQVLDGNKSAVKRITIK